jgi:alpha-D-xyloside xylohydrolase
LDQIPVFVKDGAVIPMMPPLLHAPATGVKIDLTIRVYGEKKGEYALYDDDGETFNYEKGDYSWRKITITTDKKGKLAGSISPAVKGKPDNIGKVDWVIMSDQKPVK